MLRCDGPNGLSIVTYVMNVAWNIGPEQPLLTQSVCHASPAAATLDDLAKSG